MTDEQILQSPVWERVRGYVAETYDVKAETITPATHFGHDLDDSLELVEVVMACEEEFNITIPDEEASGLETVGQLVAYIDGRPRPDNVWPPPPKRPT